MQNAQGNASKKKGTEFAKKTLSRPPSAVQKPANKGARTRVREARANLSVKAGAFSIGAFAASNRGQLEDFYEVETKAPVEPGKNGGRKIRARHVFGWGDWHMGGAAFGISPL